MNISKKEGIRLILIGGISGFLAGFLGGCGALFSILALKKIEHIDLKTSQATSMSYIWIVTLICALILGEKFEINISLVKLILILSIYLLGAFLGKKIFKKASNAILEMILGIILIVAGGLMIWQTF